VRSLLYIGGQWSKPASDATIAVQSAVDGSIIGTVPDGTPGDVDRAVQAAVAAFPAWSARPGPERAAYCSAIADGLAARADEIAALITAEVGTPLRLSRALQAALPVTSFRAAAALADAPPVEDEVGRSLVIRQPVGVVAAITPWNYPLHQIAAKVAYAMAAGCTVILKPSEVAPLNAFVLAEVVAEARLPGGVFNLVTGTGPVVGEALVRHPAVDKVSFTGSTRAGRRVAALAAESLTRVALELGGKSANILLDDLDDQAFEAAVRSGVGKCFLNSGQTCTAFSRMLVPRDRADLAGKIAASETTSKYQPGLPTQPGVRVGPLASASQVERVVGYIKGGIAEGATVAVGGPEPPHGLPEGFFVQPTVFTNVTNDMTIAREEIFGPVLSIIGYDGEQDAISIANDSPYGLSGAVVASSYQRAEFVARQLRTGQVEINNGSYNPEAPFGGFKNSGYGRELGRLGFEEFRDVTTLFR
jgi:aldehyde dehydrogenase (NAD+)